MHLQWSKSVLIPVLSCYAKFICSAAHVLESRAAIDDDFKKEIPSLAKKSKDLQTTIQAFQALPANSLKGNVKDRFVELMTPFAETSFSQANVRCMRPLSHYTPAMLLITDLLSQLSATNTRMLYL